VAELAIWAIGNILAGSIEMRDHILSYHPISILANLLDKAIPDSSSIKIPLGAFQLYAVTNQPLDFK